MLQALKWKTHEKEDICRVLPLAVKTAPLLQSFFEYNWNSLNCIGFNVTHYVIFFHLVFSAPPTPTDLMSPFESETFCSFQMIKTRLLFDTMSAMFFREVCWKVALVSFNKSICCCVTKTSIPVGNEASSDI